MADPSPVPGPVSQTSQEALKQYVVRQVAAGRMEDWIAKMMPVEEVYLAGPYETRWVKAADHEAALQQAQADANAYRVEARELQARVSGAECALGEAQATLQRLEQERANAAASRSVMSSAVPEVRPLVSTHRDLRPTVQAEQEAGSEGVEEVQRLKTSLTAAQATIPHLQALVAQRGEDLQWLIEQVEPTLLAQHRHKGDPYETCEARACARVREIKARLAALLSAIPAPRETQEEETKEEVARVGRLTAGAVPTGSTAEDRTGDATAAKRTERMPACATCGHAWGEHARPPDVDADVDDGKRWCFALTDDGECRCQNYEEPW